MAALGALVALAACSESIAPSGLVGTYAVIRFNGTTVPATVFTVGPTTWTLLSGTLELRADNTWSIVYPMRSTTGAESVASDPIPHDVGTFTLAGAVLTLRDSTAGSSFVADVTGSTVVMRSGLVNSFGFATLEFSRP